MPEKKIMCPVDLSDNSLAAVELATTLAKVRGARIDFIYVSPHLVPEAVLFATDQGQQITVNEKVRLEQIHPVDLSVPHSHLHLHGNAGPEIVRLSAQYDMIVMSTHGYGALLRLLLGGVAQYTLRHAKCPVVLFRDPAPRTGQKPAPVESGTVSNYSNTYVTEVMHAARALLEDDTIDGAIAELDRARQDVAPVVDLVGRCVGVLTRDDIRRYQEMKRCFESGDETAVNAIFEIDKFGQRRTNSGTLSKVKMHIGSPVQTISNASSLEAARKCFLNDETAQYIVVVDDEAHPLRL